MWTVVGQNSQMNDRVCVGDLCGFVLFKYSHNSSDQAHFSTCSGTDGSDTKIEASRYETFFETFFKDFIYLR